MAKEILHNTRLGIFTMSGLAFLILMLYMIGKNRNMFGDTYTLQVQFDNAQGLVKGNNVRFAGIQVGTVKTIKIRSDTVIEVSLMIDRKMMQIIRKNAVVSIATDGIVGNKLVNISPAKEPAPFAVAGDMLRSKKSITTDEIMQTLSGTTSDISVIASDLKQTVKHLNSSRGLWALLEDETIPYNMRTSLVNIRIITEKSRQMANELEAIVSGVKAGKGSAGKLLSDSSFALALNEAVLQLRSAGQQADSLMTNTSRLISDLRMDIYSGKGTVPTLLKDSSLALKIAGSLENLEKGTAAFNQNMEAFKHNFLVRGYFRKQARKNK